MFKFADDTKLSHRARNLDDIMELQEGINKLVEWAIKWQMSFNVDICSVMYIEHNNMQSNINMSNQQLTQNRSTAGFRNHHHQRPKVAKTQGETLRNGNRVLGLQSNRIHSYHHRVTESTAITSEYRTLTSSALYKEDCEDN